MNGGEALVMMLLFVCTFATIFAIYYLRNKENMALIERGINPREGFRRFGSLNYLKYGLLIIGVGIGILIAHFIDSTLPHKAVFPDGTYIYQDNPEIYFSSIGIFGGLGLVISYFIEKKEMSKQLDKE